MTLLRIRELASCAGYRRALIVLEDVLGDAEPIPPASAEGHETARWLERVRPRDLEA